jgi:hypothetical protein
LAERYRAARPETWGVAIEVPLNCLVALEDPMNAEMIYRNVR